MSDPAAATSLAGRVSQAFPTVLLVAALFVPRVVEGLYTGLGRELPDAFGPLATLFLIASVAVWFWSYCRMHHLPWIMDMGWFLMGPGHSSFPTKSSPVRDAVACSGLRFSC